LIPVMINQEQLGGLDFIFTTDILTVPDPDWTSLPPQIFQEWFPLSECYNPLPGPPVEDYASFNGVDSALTLDHLTGNWGTTWQWSGDFYFRSLTNAHITILAAGAAVISGISPTQGYARDKTVNHGLSVPLNEWVNIRLERNWSEPGTGKLKIWVNGVEKGQNITSMPNMNMDTIGGVRPTIIPTVANLDMRNFKLEIGTPGLPVIKLDLPLQVNACDDGPLGNDGTTVNMQLASCP
ncbi:unnamed protein product, partial [marine sediment metagenome]